MYYMCIIVVQISRTYMGIQYHSVGRLTNFTQLTSYILLLSEVQYITLLIWRREISSAWRVWNNQGSQRGMI
jgi:hypothetical protein